MLKSVWVDIDDDDGLEAPARMSSAERKLHRRKKKREQKARQRARRRVERGTVSETACAGGHPFGCQCYDCLWGPPVYATTVYPRPPSRPGRRRAG